MDVYGDARGFKKFCISAKNGHIFQFPSYNLPIEKKLTGGKKGERCRNVCIINLYYMRIYYKSSGLLVNKKRMKCYKQ